MKRLRNIDLEYIEVEILRRETREPGTEKKWNFACKYSESSAVTSIFVAIITRFWRLKSPARRRYRILKKREVVNLYSLNLHQAALLQFKRHLPYKTHFYSWKVIKSGWNAARFQRSAREIEVMAWTSINPEQSGISCPYVTSVRNDTIPREKIDRRYTEEVRVVRT